MGDSWSEFVTASGLSVVRAESPSADWFVIANPPEWPAGAKPSVSLSSPAWESASDPYSFELDSIKWQIRMDFAITSPQANIGMPVRYKPNPLFAFPTTYADGGARWLSAS